MKIDNKHYRTIWLNDDEKSISIIDQRKLPFTFTVENLTSVGEMATAIKDMHVRGAGLIGASAAFGMYLAVLEHLNQGSSLEKLASVLKSTRPTAVNLTYAVDRIMSLLHDAPQNKWVEIAKKEAQQIADEDAHACRRIGQHGVKLIEKISQRKNGETVNVLTHCNAGWLAFVDFGSATAPIYEAFDKDINIHVWVDETRPRNQGARLTAWELNAHGVPHTVIPDNTGGHLMQHSMVDLVITGADRVTRTGDAANKIGTYLKALAAKDNEVPFYVALPSSTFDWVMRDGIKEIPIEQRDPSEVSHISGHPGHIVDDTNSTEQEIRLIPSGSRAANYGFDVTPSRLITGLITERGICDASESGVVGLFPEKK